MVLGMAVDSNVLSYPVLVSMKVQGAVIGRGGASPQPSVGIEPVLRRRARWSLALGHQARWNLPLDFKRGGASPQSSGEVESSPRGSGEAKPSFCHSGKKRSSVLV